MVNIDIGDFRRISALFLMVVCDLRSKQYCGNMAKLTTYAPSCSLYSTPNELHNVRDARRGVKTVPDNLAVDFLRIVAMEIRPRSM